MNERVTLVTGASKGIGRACAEHLAGDGHHVVGVARSDPDGEFPGDLLTADLGDHDAAAAFLADVSTRYEFNGLVNNVGTVRPIPLDEITDQDYADFVQLNMTAPFQCAQALLPTMKAQGFGRIVNISSELVQGILKDRSVYTAAKAGVIGFTRAWTLELGTYGITVNAVAPGPIETPMFTRNHPPGSKKREARVSSLAVGRFGKPEDVAHAVSFFMEPESEFITGQTLFVCGGSSLNSGALM
ncbi:MAG: short-chain dehydrogenase [Alphaproteobacteria bacterium]|nr:short-chain dehydrogenase [Alphaproteobacteria bacterium]|tara:strand:+ start:2753 stop:3481 length:729 start_codon:yes stop_codon:yes gene_type:complete